MLLAQPDLGIAFLHSFKRLAMSVAVALMHHSDCSQLRPALQCMQQRKLSDCCREHCVPGAEVQSVNDTCALVLNHRTRMKQEATSPEATNLLRGCPFLVLCSVWTSDSLGSIDRWHDNAMAKITCR